MEGVKVKIRETSQNSLGGGAIIEPSSFWVGKA
jgi:hypothetical protein